VKESSFREHLFDEFDQLIIKSKIRNFDLNLRIALEDDGVSKQKLPSYDFFIDALFYDINTKSIKDPTYKGISHLDKGVF
jgi:hypothetical protein